jgi:long-chain acyl-CoA synthetase
VPVYPTLPARQIEYILRDSGAAAVFVSSAVQLAKIQEIRSSLPSLRHVVAFDAGLEGVGVLGFEAFLSRGREGRDRWPDWREALSVVPDDL